MRKKKFYEIKIGEYFKYYNKVYRKYDCRDAIQLIGEDCFCRFFRSVANVIPVTVTIKVKEK